MKIIKITMTPSEPYFFGTERCAVYRGDERSTQRSMVNPYFLRSNTAPSQSTLFGVTRFLGVREPRTNGSLSPEEQALIGTESFSLLKPGQSFGALKAISPLSLVTHDGTRELHLLPEPGNQFEEDKKVMPFERFAEVDTTLDKRWLPEGYNSKKYHIRELVCAETAKRYELPYDTQIRVGINRVLGRSGRNDGGFFKKEYVILDSHFSFRWYALLDDAAFARDAGYTESGSRTVFVGQGKTAFSLRWEPEERKEGCPELKLSPEFRARYFPPVSVDGTAAEGACYAYCVSGLYYDGAISDLKKQCRLLIGDSSDYRAFQTNDRETSNTRRFSKAPEGLKLLAPGSVFLFRDKEERRQFHASLDSKASFRHGTKAGYNCLIDI